MTKNDARHASRLSHTTPVPNCLLDGWLPELTDTELRVLLVVVRATWGWQEEQGRRQRQWLSHRLLQMRTGRSSAAVSKAIEGLVQRGLLAVESGDGQPKLTANERRRERGRLYFRVRHENDSHAQCSRTIPAAGSALANAAPSLDSCHQKARWNKEKQEKENTGPSLSIDVSSLENEVVTLDCATLQALDGPADESGSRGSAGNAADAPEPPRGRSSETQDEAKLFMQRFEAAYRGVFPGEPVPAVEPQVSDLLQKRLEQMGGDTLAAWLPRFFACDFGYVRRRRWSLESYLECVFALRASYQASHSSELTASQLPAEPPPPRSPAA